jgi:glycosyltransferase involved in cell wall biosynthesis
MNMKNHKVNSRFFPKTKKIKVDIVSLGRFHLSDLARELAALDVDVRFIGSLPSYKLKQHGNINYQYLSIPIEHFRVGLRLLPIHSKLIGILDFLVRIIFDIGASFLIRKDADYVIGIAESSLNVIKKCKNLNIPFILDRGSTHIDFHLKKMDAIYNSLGLKKHYPINADLKYRRREYELADKILIPSNYVLDSFSAYGILDKFIKVPYGCDLEKFPWSKKSYTNKNKLKICYVGTMSARKNCTFFLQLINSDLKNNIEIHIAGGIDREVFDLIKDIFIFDNVYYYGHLHQNNLSEIYQKCDVFLIPSHDEGLAMVQVQALASGLPILATESSGFGEHIRKFKLGFVGPEKELFSYIESIYEKPNLVNEININTRNMRNNFSWRMYATQVLDALKMITTNNKNVK